MFDGRLRKLKDIVLDPLVGLLEKAGAGASAVTAAGAVIGLAAAAAAGFGNWRAALILWLFNRLLDGLDGALARRKGVADDLGGYIDIMADFLVYAVLPLGIAFGLSGPGREAIWPAAAFLLAACYVNGASWMYLSALIKKKGPTALPIPAGIIEGTETILFYTAALLFPGSAAPIFLFFGALVFLTASVRVAGALFSRFP